jgi:zinc protease
MKLFRIFLLFLCLTRLFSANAQFTTFPNDPIGLKQYVLPNGFTVLLSENHDLPQIYGMVVVKAGGKNDPKDATGIAHYLEHMLFKGTETMGTTDFTKEKPYLDTITALYEQLGNTSDIAERKKIQREINDQSLQAAAYAIPNELDKILSEIGSTDVNAFTTEDYTAYHNTFPSNQVERWLDVYAHRFINPVFRMFQSELETVYEEKNRMLDNSFAQVYEVFMASFYKKHPYGQQSLIGSTEHLKNPPLRKMYQFFEDYYVANNMALVLSGDFNSEEILPLIEQKFGALRSGVIPVFPEHKEEPFNGREIVQVKMTPIKAAAIGFRTPSNSHPDQAVLQVVNNLLSNKEQSGYIDKLMVDGDVLGTTLLPLNYNDHSGSMALILPKILGQSIKKAEGLVKDRIKLVQKGGFSDEMLHAVKLNLKKQVMAKWEDNSERANLVAESFCQGLAWNKYLEMLFIIENTTREDVMAVSKKYYGDNYLLFITKMGFPKKQKLEKPDFKPVNPDNEIHSHYYNEWKNLKENAQTPRFVDFEKDIQKAFIRDKVSLLRAENPHNSIFTAQIKWGVGVHTLPELKYTAEYLNFTGSQEYPSADLKQALYKLGCSYAFSTSDNEFILQLEGIEGNLEQILPIIKNFIENPELDEKKARKVKTGFSATKRIMRREPSHISDALQEYVLHGQNSSFLNDLPGKRISSLKAAELLSAFEQAKTYEVVIHYTGKLPVGELEKSFSKISFKEDLKPKTPVIVKERQLASEPVVFLVNKKGALQSQINFFIEGSEFNKEKLAPMGAFNEYFGGNMSSLVFQEIREFRSLAYSAGAVYRHPKVQGKNSLFKGFLGCQGDKTMEALDVMAGLINNMPEKREREEMVKSALIQESASARPTFRNLLKVYEGWMHLAYESDPNQIKLDQLSEISFESIRSLYENDIKGRNITITVVGDAKNFRKEELRKYGKLVEVKQSKLFAN